MEIELKGITSTPSRHNPDKLYWFWRRAGLRASLLTDDLGNKLDGPSDPRFQAYVKRLNAPFDEPADETEEIPDIRDTLQWLVREYENSERFRGVSKRTQENYTNHFRQILRMRNDDDVRLSETPLWVLRSPPREDIERGVDHGKALVRGIRDAKRAHRVMANELKTTLGTLLSWANELGYVDRNVAKEVRGIRRTKEEKRERKNRKARAWPQPVREKFCDAAREMGYAELPLAQKLLYYTTQRTQDVVSARQADLYLGEQLVERAGPDRPELAERLLRNRGRRFLVIEDQHKTDMAMTIMMHRVLEEELDRFGIKGPFLLMYQDQRTGFQNGVWKPTNADLMGDRFGRVIREAGLQGQEMRMLRSAGSQVAKRLVQGGAEGSVADLTGWSKSSSDNLEDLYTLPEPNIAIIEAWEKEK